MFYINNIREIKDLSLNNDGTMRVCLVADAKDYDSNTTKQVEVTFPRFTQDKSGALSLLPSPDNKLYGIEVDPLIVI